jgi:hypothetical protein
MKIKLRKCAYIFHPSNDTYFFGTKKDRETKHRVNAFFKAYYEDPEKRERALNAEERNGEFYLYLEDLGIETHLNALMIAWTEDPNHIINHRKIINAEEIENKYFHHFSRGDLYSNRFSTFKVEFFTAPEELGYIRIYFKNASFRFIVDDRTNEFYTSGEHGKHEPISRQYIKEHLGIESKAAEKELYSILDSVKEYKGGKTA